jgi:hypothetical protein
MALSLHGLFPDREVVAFHYRGYGQREQFRSNLPSDADLGHDPVGTAKPVL